jgi:hypothetical protein
MGWIESVGDYWECRDCRESTKKRPSKHTVDKVTFLLKSTPILVYVLVYVLTDIRGYTRECLRSAVGWSVRSV